MPARHAKRVLFIGWDAADWKVIHPLLDAGKMPGVRHLVENGVMANMATLHPVLSPMLWTSIGTGKRPMKHGIFGFTEPTPDGQSVRPVTNLSRKCKAVWNILSQSGLKTHVVGWWPSHPAEPINGAMVSNHYYRAFGPLEKGWPLAPGCVHPPRLHRALAELRFHPTELTDEEVLPFVPRAGEIDQEKDQRLASLMKVIAECTSVHAAATWLMEHEPWDFMAVYYDAIDHFSHLAMKYHPPRQPWISEEDFGLYQDVINSAYRYHDLMLRRLLQLAGADTTVILMSDHGFHPDHLRPRFIPREPAGPAVEHRDFGIFAMKGPGIRRDQFIHGVNLLDVTPTILTLFGLPVGDDMDGRPLVEAFEVPPEPKSIPSWDDVPGRDGRHPTDAQLDPFESQEALNQLVALGYIEKPDQDHEKAVGHTVRELRYNLARAQMNADQHAAAAVTLRELWEQWPSEHRFAIQLAFCHRALGRIAEMRELVSEVEKRRRSEAKDARAKLKEWKEKLGQRQKEKGQAKEAGASAQPGRAVAAPIPAAARPAPDPAAGSTEKPAEDSLLTAAEREEITDLRAKARINPFGLAYLRGYAFAAEGRHEEALAQLADAEKADPRHPGIHLQIGEAYLGLKRWADADRSFQRVLEIDPDNPHAHFGVARATLNRRRPFEAAAAALKSVGLLYRFPMAHFVLGIALVRLGKVRRAIRAFEIALEQNPNFPEAHAWLARIYSQHLKHQKKAAHHREMAKELREAAKKRAGGPVPTAAMPAATPEAFTPSGTRAREHAKPSVDLPGHPGPATWPGVESGDLITIVAGLPRTGTSMMMQMLAAGGLAPLTDGKRTADRDNPRGYFEFEPATRLREDPSWLPRARGRVVKLVAPLLPYLPADQHYRVIFMHRDLREVIASQQIMLKNLERKGGQLSPDRLAAVLERNVRQIARWLAGQPQIKSLHLDYGRVLADPADAAGQLNEFLGGVLDPVKAAAAVRPELRRQKVS